MPNYVFTTDWRLTAPIDAVWDAIREYQAWPLWWHSVARARRIAESDGGGLGEVVEFEFRAAGELEGTGRWRLAQDGDETVVRYVWEVRTTRWWMNLLALVARPLFAWNHDQVMESGRTGLVRLLAGRPPV